MIRPYQTRNPTLSFVVGGYSRLRKVDVWFRNTWGGPTFGGHSAFLVGGRAENQSPESWQFDTMWMEIVGEPPYSDAAATIYEFNRERGADQARFDEMAARLYGSGPGSRTRDQTSVSPQASPVLRWLHNAYMKMTSLNARDRRKGVSH